MGNERIDFAGSEFMALHIWPMRPLLCVRTDGLFVHIYFDIFLSTRRPDGPSRK